MTQDPYKVLGVNHGASIDEIKASYRSLVKKYHPDKGGCKEKILEINAAWEKLKGKKYNYKTKNIDVTMPKKNFCDNDQKIAFWLKFVYLPIDRLIAEIINPFPKQLKDLSADPYDDILMEDFCDYIQRSQKKIKKVQEIYQSTATPLQARSFSLNLYQCFSEIQDGINELERYTSGYVESYLHDGNEMLRNAKKQRLILQKEKKYLISD